MWLYNFTSSFTQWRFLKCECVCRGTPIAHHVLSVDDKLMLEKEALEDEVHIALFQMHPWKAPGIDGLHAGFYQEFWDTVKSSLVELVSSALNFGRFSGNLNQVLLVLITKVATPENVKQFRQISLCTVVAYKLIKKVLVNRLWPLLNTLIALVQISFIPSQQAVDNILIA